MSCSFTASDAGNEISLAPILALPGPSTLVQGGRLATVPPLVATPSDDTVVFVERSTTPTWISTPPTPPRSVARNQPGTAINYSRPISLPPSTSMPTTTMQMIGADSINRLSLQERRFNGFQFITGDPLDRLYLHISPPFRQETAPEVFQFDPDSEKPEHIARMHTTGYKDQAETGRRYYALMELLRTEVKYLFDLRVLVTIYLQHLSTACFTLKNNASNYFGSSSTFGMPMSPFVPLTLSGDTTARGRSRSVTERKETDTLSQRRIFSDEEVVLISRNAGDLLDFHDSFVERLREIVEPFGPTFSFASMDDESCVNLPSEATLNEVIDSVMSCFIEKSSFFNIYRSFCSTHTEACEMIQDKKKQYPVEWVIFEKRCRELVLNVKRTESKGIDMDNAASPNRCGRESSESSDTDRHPKRQKSTPSFPSYISSKSLQNHSAQNYRSEIQSSRLVLTDYLIKPVQRICKYNLLLAQLQVKKSTRNEPAYPCEESPPDHSAGSRNGGLVRIALEAMRSAVDLVNNDRRKHEYHFKTLLVASRIATPPLNVEFLRSLGACLLVGALDVVYHRPLNSSTAKAKYLGTFLYAAGYLVLAKVAKNKVYEPVHWFPLGGFEVIDQEDDDRESISQLHDPPLTTSNLAGFPYSFHLTGQGHHFQFAAACQKEKQAWMKGLNESIFSTPEFLMDSITSLREENRTEVFSTRPSSRSSQDISLETPLSLPTINSRPELELRFAQPIQRTFTKPLSHQRPKTSSHISTDIISNSIRLESVDRTSSISRTLSRKSSSTASVKSLFSPFLFEFGTRINRSSSIHRQHVDQGLFDVFSDLCRDARSQAEINSVELFQLHKRPSVTHRPSNSMAASVLRSKREPKLRSRRSYAGADSLECGDRHGTLSHISSRLTFGGTSAEGVSTPWTDGTFSFSPAILADYSPNPLSVCSSDETSGGGSLSSSPVETTCALPPPSTPAGSSSACDWEFSPKRSQSVVDNVMSFFSARPTPGHAPMLVPKQQNPEWSLAKDVVDEADSTISARRRTLSMPAFIVKEEKAEPPPAVLCEPHESDTVVETEMVEEELKHTRKKPSFLHPNLRQTRAFNPSNPPGPVRRKSLKDVLHHFRSNSFTPIDT